MIDWIAMTGLLAQAPEAPPGGAQGSPLGALLLPMVAIFFLWYWLILRPQRRDQSKRETMLQSVKKNDRVVTIGGMRGSVGNISADGKEVTLKIDDNTRIRFLRSSIQSVVTSDDDDD